MDKGAAYSICFGTADLGRWNGKSRHAGINEALIQAGNLYARNHCIMPDGQLHPEITTSGGPNSFDSYSG